VNKVSTSLAGDYGVNTCSRECFHLIALTSRNAARLFIFDLDQGLSSKEVLEMLDRVVHQEAAEHIILARDEVITSILFEKVLKEEIRIPHSVSSLHCNAVWLRITVRTRRSLTILSQRPFRGKTLLAL
jgi:hypothetical protein